MSEWPCVKFGDHVDLLTGYPFKSNEYTDNIADIRLISGYNIMQGYLRWDRVNRWPAAQAAKLNEYKLKENDVVLAMDRPWIEAGLKYAWMREEDVPSLLVQRTARLRGTKTLDVRFLRYLVASPEFTAHIQSVTTGTAVPHISPSGIKSFEFSLPPLPTQRRIAEILGRLDDKIELNRRLNWVLEEMAQALYKHHFLDFGPYQEGEFVGSELGLVPKGWKVKPLRDVCNLTMGLSPKSKFYNELGEGLPFHQGVTDFGSRFLAHRRYCTVQPRVAKKGDILFSVRAPVGRINLADQKIVIGRGLAAINHQLGLNSFLLYQLKSIFTEEDSIGSGTIFNAVSKKELGNVQLLAPPYEIACQFNRSVGQCDEMIETNALENLKLVEIRDYLLPRLLSGEIEV